MEINFSETKGLRQIYIVAFANLIENMGGKAIVLDEARNAYRQGLLTQKQEYDFRQKVNEVYRGIENNNRITIK